MKTRTPDKQPRTSSPASDRSGAPAQARALGRSCVADTPRQSDQHQQIAQLGGSAAPSTSMPEQLKRGIAALSGHDLSDVQVHRSSARPAQLSAEAYAQGRDIHLASGKEHHLPHEAWHIVQQRQGRVRPTGQIAGQALNDDQRLEREADAMGARALQMKAAGPNDDKAIASPSEVAHAIDGPPVLQGAWERDSNPLVPDATFVDWETGDTYNPGTKELINGNTQDRVVLTLEQHEELMTQIKQENFAKNFPQLTDLGSMPAMAGMFHTVQSHIHDTLPSHAQDGATKAVIEHLFSMMPMIDGIEILRPITLNAAIKSLGESAIHVADGKAPTFDKRSFYETVEQEGLALHLIDLKAKGKHGAFQVMLRDAVPKVRETKNGYTITIYLGDIELGEVILVILNGETLELHFNVSSPLKYIGVASELWKKGVEAISKLDKRFKKMTFILPAFSQASTLMVTRQIANVGGDPNDFKLGTQSRNKRKGTENVSESSTKKQEMFKSGGQDDETDDELKHYLRSIAKTIYTRNFGIVGYINPWKLLQAYGISMDKVEDRIPLVSERMMDMPSTLAGHLEVQECHKLLGVPFQETEFVAAVESKAIVMMLGMSGESFIDFSLENKTMATIQRWWQLR